MIWILLYLLASAICTALLCTGWGLYVNEDFFAIPVLSGMAFPIGLPACGGFIAAKYLIGRWTL